MDALLEFVEFGPGYVFLPGNGTMVTFCQSVSSVRAPVSDVQQALHPRAREGEYLHGFDDVPLALGLLAAADTRTTWVSPI